VDFLPVGKIVLNFICHFLPVGKLGAESPIPARAGHAPSGVAPRCPGAALTWRKPAISTMGEQPSDLKALLREHHPSQPRRTDHQVT
jgi:hypothetical protein